MVSIKLTMVFFICVCVCVCVSTVDFWFVVTMRFWCSYLYICVCAYAYTVYVCVYTQDYFKLLVSLFQHVAFPTSCICTLLFSQMLVVIWYFCVGDFLPLLYVCLYQWTFPFMVFSLLIVAFSLASREIPLAFVVKLLWCCWILLAFACL